MKLELRKPTKPYKVNQPQGVYNEAYLPLGFDHHNGIDIAVDEDSILLCPVNNLYIYEVGYNSKSGFFIKGNTMDSYDFEDGVNCYVNMFFLHLKEMSPRQVGDVLRVGDALGIQGNTGFSTGPHTHWGCRRIKSDGTFIDQNNAGNTFDQSRYLNGYHAEDKGIMLNIISLAKKAIELLKGRNTTT